MKKWSIPPLFLLCAACQSPADPRPSHHTDGGFRNQDTTAPQRGPWDLIRWKWNSNKPDPITFSQVQVDLSPWRNNDTAGTHALWIGHSTFLLKIKGLTVLTDPIFSERASPVSWAGPKRSTPPALALDSLPPIDVVILSHDHYDHTDLPSLRALAQRKNSQGGPTVFMTPLGFAEWFKDQDLPPAIEKDWWQEHRVGAAKFTPTPVQHWGKRGLFGQNQRLWCGWMIEINGVKVYFGGDTGYSADFTATRERLGSPDLALLPIGAYAPEWFMAPQHVNPEQAVQIHQDLGARQSIGMHWGTFQMTDEPMDEPPQRLARALKTQALDSNSFVAIYHGALLTLGAQLPKVH